MEVPGVGVLVQTMSTMIEAEANMRNTTKALAKHQEIDMALTGKGGLLESHLMVKKKSTVDTMKEREVDMIGP